MPPVPKPPVDDELSWNRDDEAPPGYVTIGAAAKPPPNDDELCSLYLEDEDPPDGYDTIGATGATKPPPIDELSLNRDDKDEPDGYETTGATKPLAPWLLKRSLCEYRDAPPVGNTGKICGWAADEDD